MHGVALRTNTLIFSTTRSEADSVLSNRFHWALRCLEEHKNNLLNSSQRTLDSQMIEKLALKHKHLVSVFHPKPHPFAPAGSSKSLREVLVDTDGRLGERGWGGPRLEFRQLVEDALQLLWDEKHDTLVEIWRRFHRPGCHHPLTGKLWSEAHLAAFAQFLTTRPLPWEIPSDDNVALVAKNSTNGCGREALDVQFHMNYVRHRFSAAAVAISFLRSASPRTLLQRRKIILREDHESVAFPECHGMGLIDFCLEYPGLHIERRVHVWRNLLSDGSDYLECEFPLYRIVDVREGSWGPWADEGDRRDQQSEDSEQLQSSEISNSFCSWIEETLGLYDAGMPVKSFTLVFDAEGSPERTSEVFEVVKRDAAWQTALDLWCEEKGITPLFGDRRRNASYHSERLPKAVSDMVAGVSPIRCNFPIGSEWDAQQVLEDNMDATDLKDWEKRWFEGLHPKGFQTAPPLPSWLAIRLDRVKYTQEQLDSIFEARRRHQQAVQGAQ